MRQLVYALRFRGNARRGGIDGNVLAIVARAPGCTIRTWNGAAELSGLLQAVLGDGASLASELASTGASTFQAVGTIAFGTDEHRLRVSTVGSGHLRSAPGGDRRHGAAIWQVDGGEGQFAGASGLIASNFVVSTAGEVTDHQLGMVFVREAAVASTRPPAKRWRRNEP